MDGSVCIGHYVSAADGWAPALEQSTDLFRAVVADDISRFEAHADGLTAAHKVLYWSHNKKVEVKSRTLAMLATQHGALRVLAALLAKGANPKLASDDGLSCYEFIDSTNPNAPTIRAMLDDAAGNFGGSTEAPQAGAAPHGRAPTPDALGAAAGMQQAYAQQDLEGDLELPYSTADLTRPEYSTDTFRMYCFKVLRCSKRYAHDWRACPFAHPTENARRRDPREFRYSSLVCPDYRQGCCVRGDTCQYAHGVFESWLHPSRYRTQLCKDQDKCDRPVCFFAHSINELRSPVDNFVPDPEERLRVPEAMQVVLGMAAPGSLAGAPAGDTGYADQNQPLDLLSSQQLHSSSTSSLVGLPAASSSSGGGAGSSGPPGSSAGGAGASSSGGACSSGGASLPEAVPAYAHDQGSAPGGASPSPNKQLVSPSAVPVPRMSNAFARKHGLDPKENPLVNLQRLAMQQVAPQGGGGQGPGRRQRRGRQQPLQHHPQHHPQAPSPQPQLLQPLGMQPQQLMQPPLSPAAAAAYYGAPPPMQPGHQAPPPLLDPQAMALLFGGMNLGPPMSPAAAAAMAGGGMSAAAAAAAGMHQQLSPMAYGMAAAPGMAGGGAMLGGAGLAPSGLGPPSPLGQPGLHPSTGMPSPQPPF